MLNPSDETQSTARSQGTVEEGEIEGEAVGPDVPSQPSKRRRYERESLVERPVQSEKRNKHKLRPTNIIWVDLEMTGLNIETDTIMEMACIVTDKKLNILGEGPNLIIHHTDEQLEAMGDWCTQQHGRTGLTRSCKHSVLTLEDVEDRMLSFVQKYCPKGRCELAGNSIHCDRKFIEKYMPRFLEHLHYRIIDVSTIRNVASRWYPNFERFESQNGNHRALNDIRSSIKELIHYKKTIFKSREQYTADLNPVIPLDDLFSQFESRKDELEKINEENAEENEENAEDISDQNLGVESHGDVLGKSPIQESLKLFGDF